MAESNTIPRLAFTYWSGKELSYLHLLSLQSFCHFNPGWDVVVYTDKDEIASSAKSFASTEHDVSIKKRLPLDLLLHHENVRHVAIDFETEYGIGSRLFHTYFADYVRIKKLHEHGGLWFDMDVLFFKPIPDAWLALPSEKSVVATSYSETIPTGLLAAVPQSEILEKLSAEADKVLDEGVQKNHYRHGNFKDHYQSIGPDLWRKYFYPYLNDRLKSRPDTHYYEPEVVYPYLWNEVDRYFYDTQSPNRINDETLGIHWYNGSRQARNYINSGLAYANVQAPKTPFEHSLSRLVKNGMKIDCKTAKPEPVKIRSEQKISIVMGYLNRRAQLINTLKSFEKSRQKNIEIIIVDDGSTGKERVASFIEPYRKKFDIHVVEVSPEEKTWLNPCVAYNSAIRRASGEIVVIQNPEVMHVGDCLSFIAQNLKSKEWLSLNCYGSGSFDENKIFSKARNVGEIVKQIQSHGFRIGGNSVQRDDVGGWLNHYEKHFVAYHYCAAVYRDDLMEDLAGGFDEAFGNLLGGDDDELIKRMIAKGFKFKINKLGKNTPFTIHQFHEKSSHVSSSTPELIAETRALLDERITELGFEPENNIHKAPLQETPMGHRILV